MPPLPGVSQLRDNPSRDAIVVYPSQVLHNFCRPQGANGRTSNDTMILELLGFGAEHNLPGMEKTYRWIYDEYSKMCG